ncbi:hypothetical protein BC937DRAFT_88979 [Endogone sp. FLAS-F59071]|nr:hypothetical protein BC937DRAFT_88979 [Endogone sp. FLAS-F59071]|eukprot:RUS18267.1 hypothetical protein BC937DRAFT_88979 [Endogone sp. FLAS-F59071]
MADQVTASLASFDLASLGAVTAGHTSPLLITSHPRSVGGNGLEWSLGHEDGIWLFFRPWNLTTFFSRLPPTRNSTGSTDGHISSANVNVTDGPQENREMRTGWHTVVDVHCCQCMRVVGWKYIKAFEESEKYKEGQFVLEKVLFKEVV